MSDTETQLTRGQAARLACILEATVRKPGNVHRYADFEDVTYLGFILSATAIEPVIENAAGRKIGEVVLDSVKATRSLVNSNTNLGIAMLLAPLATAKEGESVREGINDRIAASDAGDTEKLYEAIRHARPGGMGTVDVQDLRQKPECTLLEAMTLAAGKDTIARQFTNGFKDIFDTGLTYLGPALKDAALEDAIIQLHLFLMSEIPDTLIARKLGTLESEEAAKRAKGILDAGWPNEKSSRDLCSGFDRWLRERGNQRNPGTTADLVTAVIFLALLNGQIPATDIARMRTDGPFTMPGKKHSTYVDQFRDLIRRTDTKNIELGVEVLLRKMKERQNNDLLSEEDAFRVTYERAKVRIDLA
ncbi:MAG: triphosphoribosyl-dephospho-CoA synthase [Planctomycetota bacterium]|nr:triphosphoribosyl-dephospho-CoA synthase [Planctomycetota bacterium]MDA1142983.1 triphosphoribosyl-dephospho-CoA synthase [Planctomycetota bacterium]